MIASDELQEVIRTRLLSDAVVTGFIGQGVYDGRPKASNFPCVTFGPSDFVEDDYECIPGGEETLQLDVWSRDHGKLWPCKQVVAAVKAALHEAEIEMTSAALIEITVPSTRVAHDPDGLTAHGIVTVRAILEAV